MNFGRAFRNPYLVLSVCLVFSYISVSVLSNDISFGIAVFIAISLLSFFIRPIYDVHLKSLSYVTLGMLAYWTFGHLFVLCAAGPDFPVPTLIALSGVAALAVLITYSDGRLSGHMFAAGSLFLLFNNTQGLSSWICPMLVFASVHSFVYFISKIRSPNRFNRNVLYGSLLSGTLLVLASLSRISMGAMLGVHGWPPPISLLEAILPVLAANVLFSLLSLKTFDFMLARMKLMRFVEDDRVLYGSIAKPEER